LPRPRDPANEAQRSAQERWRARARKAGRPEVDAVDTAVSVAVAVFVDTVKDKPAVSTSRQRAEAIERMAVNYLGAIGWNRDEAFQMVRRRLHRSDAELLSKIVIDDWKEGVRPPVTT
jgi:hypothetical protein